MPRGKGEREKGPTHLRAASELQREGYSFLSKKNAKNCRKKTRELLQKCSGLLITEIQRSGSVQSIEPLLISVSRDPGNRP